MRQTPPAHIHTHTHSYSITWAPKTRFSSPNGFIPHMAPCRSVFPVCTALDLLREVWVPHLWRLILESWTGNAWPHKEHWCCQAKFATEGGPKMHPVNSCWVRITSCTAFKTKCSVQSEGIPLTLHIPSSLECLQTGNLLTVWKLIIRQLIQLSSTGIINSIYLPAIRNDSCLERTKQNMID